MTGPHQEPPAELGRRVFAYLVDVALAAGLALVLSGVLFGIVVINAASSDRSTVALGVVLAASAVSVAMLAWGVVYTALQGGGGSIGQRAAGIRLADPATGSSIGFSRALLRNIVWAASTAILIGYLTVFFDGSGRRRGWHDAAARAIVVDRTRRPVTTASHSAAPAPRAPSVGLPAVGRDTSVPVLEAAGSALHGVPAGRETSPVISFVPGVTRDPMAVPHAASRSQPVPPHETAAVTPPAMQTIARAGRDDPAGQTRTAPAPITSLTWDDGTRIGVYGRTLFGRNPAGEPGASVVALRDETLSLSKTHFEVGGDAGGAWVLDRNSTNGTAVVRDGDRIELAPGQRMPVRPGDRLEFGDRSAAVGGAA